jgi:alkanesulfonate monooxygenase SsuD/methylene tetrahydromethanopterin reductase-like flavin-dependent oxidoreductase (luciferase family)
VRVGISVFAQHHEDWERFEAEERGDDVPPAPGARDQQIFLEEVELAKLADQLGYDSVWAVEHHFTPYTMITNPLQLLTYLAGVTEKIHVGTMVCVLPWWNPVRLAEEVSMLETFLGDRTLTLGLGRGIGRREYNGLMVDQGEARGRFDEGVEILMRALRGERFSFHGEYFNVDDVVLRPQPKPNGAVENLYFAGNSPASFEGAAKRGLKQLIIPQVAWEVHAAQLKSFAAARADAGFGPFDPKSGVWIYCAETEAEARVGAEQYMVEYGESTLRHYELLGGHFAEIKGYEIYAERAAALREDTQEHVRRWFDLHPWGTPDQVAQKVIEITDHLHPSEIMCVFRYGSMPYEKAEKSMRLFAQDVLPQLKEIEYPPISAEGGIESDDSERLSPIV